MGKLTTKLLQQAANITSRHMAMQHKLSEAFIERYGVTYSDADCDDLIEVLDYQGGEMTLKHADEQMTAAGYPPIKGTEHDLP